MTVVEVTRTYGGLEGRRVKAGTRFAVNCTVDGMKTITKPRADQLRGQRLVRDLDVTSAAAAPGAKPAPQPRRGAERSPPNKSEPDSKPRPNPRRTSRKRTQTDEPGEPRPLARGRQAGGPDGTADAASSSREDRQAGSVTFKQRGTRRQGSGGSPSTTPVSLSKPHATGTSSPASRRGQTSSTPVTPPGGAPSTESVTSEVLD